MHADVEELRASVERLVERELVTPASYLTLP